MLVFLPGLVQAMPQPVLAAIVIAASVTLFDGAELARLYRARTAEFGLAMACLLGVAFVGVLQGIVIAVVLSVLYIFKRVWAPYSAILGRVPGMPGWHDVERYPDASQVPGLVIVRWSAPLFFANANQFRDRIRAAVRDAGTSRPAGSSSRPSRSATSTSPRARCSWTSTRSSRRAASSSPSRRCSPPSGTGSPATRSSTCPTAPARSDRSRRRSTPSTARPRAMTDEPADTALPATTPIS